MLNATLLVVEDDPLQRRLIKENLKGEGFAIFDVGTGKEALKTVRDYPIDVAVVDYKLGEENGLDVIQGLLQQNPLITPIMVTAYGNVETAVEAMKKGAYDYIVKPIDFEKFMLVIRRALERQKLRQEVSVLRHSLEERFSAKNFVFASSRMEEVTRLISKAARSDATVLISGETGTGKDLVAKSIHFSSRRKDGPYLAVNIPSLPETLIESELFGAEKGAFTGAHERRIGKFEAASGGTLFLDEIGDLPIQLQVKLLRFLQEREFFRLGSSKPLQSDVRILAATNRDLEEMVKAGAFRQDLYYRLNVIRIHVPRLRERREDIPPLVDHFIRKYGEREGKTITGISSEALRILLGYSFPGNIRELENVIERAVVFCEESEITSADLPLFLQEAQDEGESEADQSLPQKVRLLESREIKKALRAHSGIKSRAARALGITERILSYKIKTHGLDPRT
jgi:two-component system NtrC family response regulator